MDAENKPAAHGADVVSPAANDKSAEQWRLILLVLCAVGAVLVIGILALQVTEYRFYKASPNVWPQPGASGSVSAPVALVAPLPPAPATISSAAPATVSAPESPAGQTSTPAAAASVSVPAPAAAKP